MEENKNIDYYMLGSYSSPSSVYDDDYIKNIFASNKAIKSIEIIRVVKKYNVDLLRSLLGVEDIEKERDEFSELEKDKELLQREKYLKDVTEVIESLHTDEKKLDLVFLKINKKTREKLYIKNATKVKEFFFQSVIDKFMNPKMLYNKFYDDTKYVEINNYKTVKFRELDINQLFINYGEQIPKVYELDRNFSYESHSYIFKNPLNLNLYDGQYSMLEYKYISYIKSKDRNKVIMTAEKKLSSLSLERKEEKKSFITKLFQTKKDNQMLFVVNTFQLNFYNSENIFPNESLKQIKNFKDINLTYQQFCEIVKNEKSPNILLN